MELSDILAPFDEEIFFVDYWEAKPLLIERGRADYFSELLNLSSLNDILSGLQFRADECKVARAGDILPAEHYASRSAQRVMEREAPLLIDTRRLLQLFSQGATLMFSQLNHKWQPLQTLKQGLEQTLGASVLSNVYLTSSKAQGFPAHYDSHDMFVLQLHGSKTWTLYDNPVELPLKSQAFGRSGARCGECRAQLMLRAGDVLYLPRGYFYEARAGDGPSLHLTLGVHPYLWVDYLHDLLDQLSQRRLGLRRALPRHFSRLPVTELLQEKLALLLTDSALAERVYDERLETLTGTAVTRQDDHLRQILSADRLGLSSRLRRRCGRLQVSHRQGTVSLGYAGQWVSFPPSYRPAVEFVRARAEFCVAELPDELCDEKKIAFARKLIDAALLTAEEVSVQTRRRPQLAAGAALPG